MFLRLLRCIALIVVLVSVPAVIVSAGDFECNQVTEIPQAECEALVALYNSTDGDNWTTNLDWLVTNTPCSWFGLACYSGHVGDLFLYDNNLSGAIPSELGSLSELQFFSIYENSVLVSGKVELQKGTD